MMVSSTTPIKKRKRSTAPDGTKKNKKRLKVNNVPELILCAKQLKSDVKEEDDVYEPILQSEIRNSVYLCQSIKSEPCDLDVDHKSVKIKVKKKKKKSTSTKERVTHLTKELISEDNSLVFNEVKVELHSSIDKMLVKDEPVTPEKLLVKVEPSNFGTLFQSNIKQVEIQFFGFTFIYIKNKKLNIQQMIYIMNDLYNPYIMVVMLKVVFLNFEILSILIKLVYRFSADCSDYIDNHKF